MRIYTIYRATNIVNGKVYVGFDSKFPRRVSNHRNAAFNPNHHNYESAFYRAIRKHGLCNFVFEAIYESTDGEHALNTMESHFIAEYDSYRNGYNATLGGEGCLGVHTPRGGDRRVYVLCHPVLGTFEGLMKDFVHASGGDRSELTKLVKGKILSVKGWRLISIDGEPVAQRERKQNCKTTIYEFVHPEHGSFRGIVKDFVNTFAFMNMCRSEISSMCKGKTLSVKGWKVISIDGTPFKRRNKRYNIRPEVHEFVHSEHGVFKGTRNEFVNTFDLEKYSSWVSRLICGKELSCKGWRMVERRA